LHRSNNLYPTMTTPKPSRLVSGPRRLVLTSGPGRAVPPKPTVRVSSNRGDQTTTNNAENAQDTQSLSSSSSDSLSSSLPSPFSSEPPHIQWHVLALQKAPHVRHQRRTFFWDAVHGTIALACTALWATRSGHGGCERAASFDSAHATL